MNDEDKVLFYDRILRNLTFNRNIILNFETPFYYYLYRIRLYFPDFDIFVFKINIEIN